MADTYLHLNGEQKGPFSAEQLRAMLASGEITPDTLAWREGMSEWSRVSTVLGPPPPPPAGVHPPLPHVAPAQKGLSGWIIAVIVCACLLVLCVPCCCGIALGPITNGIKKAKENVAVQKARAIELAMAVYATDHNGAYPDGKTSTEVFQKLLDGDYVTDPGMFYLEMPGKMKATAKKLTAENVSFDVTSGVTTASPDSLPVAFCTGYTIIYQPGAATVRDVSLGTPFPGPGITFTGLAVAYKDGSARFFQAEIDGPDHHSAIDGSTIYHFMSPSFNAGGKTYAQLKP